MPPIHQIVTLRPEVIAGDLHGIISLYALLDQDSTTFECDPQRVFPATYPSDALKRLLQRLQTSLGQRDTDRKGNFIISGGYGAGKSHLLLTLYHLLANPDAARAWLAEHKIDFELPTGAVVVLMPMTNLTRPGSSEPVEYLWEPIFAALGYDGFKHTGNNFPTVKHLRKAVAGRKVFLIVDEIERWFMPIRDKHQAEANVSFLQNLTEFARNPDNGVFVLLALLMLEPRICNIVSRDDAFFEDLTGASDRRKVVLHRLVEAVDQKAAEQVVGAYLEQYRQVESHVHIGDYNRYRQEMLECYPFHPATIEAVFERYSSVARKEETSYQNSRGALYLLAHVLQETLPAGGRGTGMLQDVDLLLPGDISLTVDRLVDDLINLDPPLVDIARDNAARSVSENIAQAAPILSTVLLHSLGDPKVERNLGAEFGEVLLGTLRPGNGRDGITASGVQMALQRLEGTALNLHLDPTPPPRWIFRTEVNIVAQINRRARRDVTKEAARERIVETLREMVGGNVVVYPFEEIPDRRELTLVLTTERMESEAILDKLYYGLAYPNALVIVDPRHMASVADDPDLLWIAQRIIAAEGLRYDLVGDKEAQQRIHDFLDGVGGQNQNLRDQLRDRYGAWRAPIYDPQRGDLTFTRVQVPLDRTAIFREVEQRYDSARFRENVMTAVTRSTPPTIADVRAEFLRQRSFAKPVYQGRPSDALIDQAIADLVVQGQLEVIKGGDERYVCGRDPGVLQPQWTVAAPPEAHKPHFQLGQTVREVVEEHPAGVTVRELRQRCYEEAARFPGEALDDRRLDVQFSDLLARHELDASEAAAPIFGPLPDDIVLYPARHARPGREREIAAQPAQESLTFGPATVPQLKTDVVQRLNKTDVLSDVALSCRYTLHGDDLKARRDLVGLGEEDPGDARLTLSWSLRNFAVSDRDGLVALLNRLPYSDISEITIQLQCQKP